MTQAEVKLEDEKLRAEVAKLIAETRKLNTEIRWYPFVIGSSLTLAITAIVRLCFAS